MFRHPYGGTGRDTRGSNDASSHLFFFCRRYGFFIDVVSSGAQTRERLKIHADQLMTIRVRFRFRRPDPVRPKQGAPYRPPAEMTNIFDQSYDDEEEEEEEGAVCRRLS